MNAPVPREAAPAPYRWAMLAALWFGYLGFGVVNGSMAPLVAPIGEALELSHSAMGAVMGAWALVYIGAAVPSGTVLDRFGTRAGFAAGVFLVALSGFTRAIAVDFTSLFLAVAIFGVGGPLMSVGAPKMIAQWFGPKERGTAVGLYMTGPFMGTALAYSSANSVFMPLFEQSWRLTIAMFAALTLIAGIVWLVVAREPAQSAVEPGAGKSVGSFRASIDLMRVSVVRTVLYIALAAFMFNHALNAWLPEILRWRGMDPVLAGYWASVPTLVGIVSSLTIPRFATADRRVAILASLYSVLIAATLLLAFTDGLGIQIGLVLLGIARIMGPIALLVLMDAPGVAARNMGAATGLYFMVGEIGGVLGPIVVGVIADVSGGFTSALLALTALTLYLVCMTFVLRRVLARS